ncbi:hypothetical protein GIB67_026460 [Kingdonia uniflora]|uniref:Uncharacterized protein n=1 Tax=Kingdonia uniflora TaxID=39325 RepID=A0A7J7P6R7_9MAGN|nr:hypothetical protein GIB67_026460 [Kingdonia uniflora]
MLCLKAEEAVGGHEHEHDLYPPQPSILPMTFSNTIQRYLKKKKGKSGFWGSSHSRISNESSSSISIDGSPTSSGFEDSLINDGGFGKGRGAKKTVVYRSQLEKDVKTLQKQLEEEIDLHLALTSVVEHSSAPISISSCQLSDKAQDLLTNIAVLEITVSKLEEDLVALHFQLSQERNERRLAEYRLKRLPSLPSATAHSPSTPKEQISRPFSEDQKETKMGGLLLLSSSNKRNTDFLNENFRHRPNHLSEEMVLCMRNIFLCLADSSKFTSPASPRGHLSQSSGASFSDSSVIPALLHSPSVELQHDCEILESENTFDPYKVSGKINWTKDIGKYGMAAEVSWMSVGEKQLEFAAEALKGFRLLVEQLAELNPASLSSNERLAFWINLYNALIMHAYLAYGVPRSDIKHFSLMQKVAYTIGGHSFSAVDIEYIILKMKPPAHRPQIALVLALHKFKLPEEQREFSIENPDPLVAFTLSCGMHSSPAVKIFKPENVMEELHNSMRDYIQASVGISSKGKLLVPKLLHCFAKGIVEDSLLPEWICRFLSPEQASMVRDCSSHSKQRLLSARSFTVLPFDSRFRYLFLPENWTSQNCN